MPRRIESDVRNEVVALWGAHKTPKEIAALLRDSTAVARSGDGPPSVRTIQRWIAAETERRQAESASRDGRWYWQFEDGDAGRILPMLAAIAEARDGGIDSSAVDRVLAKWAGCLAREFNDVPPLELYWLATEYVMVEAEERRTRRGKEKPWLFVSDLRSSLDLYLAFAPWRDAGARYSEALWAGELGRVRPLRTPSTARALRELPPKTSAIEWPFDLPEEGAEDR
jgi:hypothetical protein